MKIRQASPTKEWDETISPQHKEILADLSGAVHSVSNKEEVDARAVIGAYGTGKTQLLYEVFNIAWEEANIPALYTDADSIVNEFESSDSDDIIDWLSRRVRDQVERVTDQKSIPWLPHYNSSSKREDWLSDVPGDSEIDDEICVLLVDEVEQAFEDLQDQIDVDDYSTLRGLLDEVEGVYQVWSFGLVSAYEILGEADVRRFKELRLPVLTTEDVYNRIADEEKPVKLTNGIWWLARGRAGWVNKLVDEMPTDSNEILDWFDRVSDYEFFGSSPVDQTVIKNRIGSETTKYNDARRSLLLLPDGLSEWEISEKEYVSVKISSDEFLRLLISDVDISADASRMLERNIERLFSHLATNRWTNDISDEHKLPYRIFTLPDEVQGLLNLIRDLVTSFEPRGESRSEAIEVLRQIETEPIASDWGTEVNSEGSDTEIRTTRPSVLSDAYPSISVDPNILTNTETEKILSQLEFPIQVDPGIPARHVNLNMYFCPKENVFIETLEQIEYSTDVRSTNVVVAPNTTDAIDWPVSGHQEELFEYEKLHIIHQGSHQLWDFLVQLSHMLDLDSDEVLSEEVISNLVEKQDSRKVVDTIETLYDQVDRIAQNSGLEARNKFRETYSLEDDLYPIWANQDLAGNSPFWHWGGSASTPIIGLSYALAVSKATVDENDAFATLPNTLVEGYRNGYLADQAKFRLSDFLDIAFTRTGYSSRMNEKRSDFGSDEGELNRPISRLQNLLRLFADIHNKDDSEVMEKLLDIDLESDKPEFWQDSNFERAQAPGLLWGLLIDGLAISYEPDDKLSDLVEICEKLASQIEDIESEIGLINSVLSTPDGVGQAVMISTDEIQGISHNAADIREHLVSLSDKVESQQEYSTIAVVYYAIVKRYLELFEKNLNSIADMIFSPDILINVDNLSSDYRSVRNKVESNGELLERTNLSKSELENQIELIGEELFNFESRIGEEIITLQRLKLLDEIDQTAKQQRGSVQKLAEQFDNLEDIQQERRSKLATSLEKSEDFLHDVVGRDE